MPRARVRHHAPIVARVGRHRHERPLAQAQQIVLPHQPQNAFVVDHKPVTAKLRCDPPISVVTIRERHTLDRVANRRLLLARCRGLPAAVIAGAADPRQRSTFARP